MSYLITVLGRINDANRVFSGILDKIDTLGSRIKSKYKEVVSNVKIFKADSNKTKAIKKHSPFKHAFV